MHMEALDQRAVHYFAVSQSGSGGRFRAWVLDLTTLRRLQGERADAASVLTQGEEPAVKRARVSAEEPLIHHPQVGELIRLKTGSELVHRVNAIVNRTSAAGLCRRSA